MNLESDGWTVIRRIGIGDKEHVRGQLFSVGCFHDSQILTQLNGCFSAGSKLGMMTRVHMNFQKRSLIEQHQIISVMHRNLEHQLIEHGNLDEQRFIEVFNTCDILVVPGGGTADNLSAAILDCWYLNGERFLRGNFQRYGNEQLIKQHPNMYPDHTSFYGEFNATVI